jgi:HAD superfamily hydrolase (TIGR01662 family)
MSSVKKAISNLTGILFDWDGTIVNSYQPMLHSLRYAYQKHLGIVFPRDNEEFRRISPMRLAESSALYAGEHAAEVAASYIWYYANEGYKSGSIFVEMREVLIELRSRGYALGVVTNTSRQRMNADVAYLQLDGMVDIIVTSEDTAERKPHPDPLLKAAEKLQKAPSELAYVGDYVGDILAAKAAGMLAIAALWGGIFLADTLLAEQPDHVTEQPGELLDIFSQRHG